MSDREVEVVISGVGGWFPGCCRSLPELAEQLLANKYLVQQQETRWKKSGDLREQPLFGTIGDCGDFDHAFFGMHQKLAYWTDPAARLCIERSFEAIIDAGLSPRELRGSKTNVYASYTFSDFEALMLDHFEAPSGYAIAGMSRTMVPNRISYFYDLKGQSCGFDGNWPWGELGLQMAQDAIRAGSCDAALVLASSVVQQPERTAQCRVMGLVSEDGLCRSFDAAASGGQRSDAVVCFVVQRADRAKRCYARVVASRCGVAGPVGAAGDPMSHNPRGVERLLRGFYRDCGEDPSKVAYLEADGSGCRLWEEAELHASGEVLAGRGQRAGKLLVGSVKSNVGHTDGCAGMLAVAKLIVAMETGVIPATINHATPNANITALRDGRLQIVTSNTALPVDGDTLLAATTLGLGGAVGHVLVKPNPKAKAPRAARSPELPRVVTVSGRTEDGVLGALRRVQAQPFDPEYLRLVQDAFTDIKGHTVRGFTLVPPSRDQPIYKINTPDRRPLVLVFSGMGSQWPGMARGLMGLPVFAETIGRLDRILREHGADVDLKNIVTSGDPDVLDRILNAFLGITAVQVALTNVLTAARLRPDLMLGHSLGELACGYADGCLTEEQAIMASYVRGRAASEAKLVKGMMAAVGVGHREVAARLPASLDVACHNSATSCTLAGPADDVRAFVDVLQAEGTFARAVNASDIAFHSRYVRPAAPLVMQGLRSVIPEPRPRSPRWLSTSVPEERWGEAEARYCSPEYQTNNLLRPVLFEEVLAHVPDDAVLLEVAPHGLLQPILKRALPQCHHLSLTQRGAADGLHFLLEAIGGLYCLGQDPVVSALCPDVEFPVSRGTPSLAPLVSWDHAERNTFLDRPAQDCRTTVTTTVTADSPFVDLNGRSFRPLSAMIMDVLSGFARVQGDKHSGAPLTMRDVHLFSLVENPSTGARQLTISFLASSGRFEMTDCSGRLVMSGRVRLLDEDDDKVAAPASRQGQGLQARQGAEPGRTLTGAALYDELRASGMSYSPRLQTLQRFSLGPHEWVAETPPHLPAQLTSSLQLMQLASLTDDNTVTFPAVIGRLDVLSGRGDGRLRFDRDTGFVESAWLRLEAVEMRPLTAGDGLTANVARGKKRHLHGSAKHWQSPESLQVKVTSVQTEEAETRPGLSAQLCGLSGEVFAEGFAGQRVMAVGLRGADERVRVDASLAWPVPHGWTDKQAAAAPLPYCKAEYALRVMARALAGESALVHDAASPLGQAAVRVALGLGCTPVFVTVRSAEERQRVLGLFPELPPQDVLMLWSFEWQLRARRRSAGVDVAVGTVSGEAFKASLRCMAFWGRYVHCASQKHPRTATMGMSKFLESLSLIGVSEDYLLLAGPETRLLLAEAVLEGVHNGTVQPIVGDGGEAAFLSTESACPSVCAMSMESVYDSGYTSPSDSVADLKSPSNSVVDLKSPSASTTDLKSPSASTTDLRPSYVSQSEEEADKRVPADVGARLLSYLPAALPSASAGADGVRLRRVPSRYGAPSSGAPTEVPAEPREVFPLLAFPPLGLPLDQRGAASLRELASRLMMPVFVVEVPGRTAGGVAGQARAVLDTLRAGGPGRGRGPYNLLGWGPSAPLALEVAHQLDAPACTFLLDGDVRTVQSWASAVAASPGGKLGALEPLRPMLRDLGALVVGPGQRHGVATSGHTDATPTAMKGGRTVVLRGSSKEASSLEGQENVEVHTVQSARLDSDEVAAQINGGAAWSRMLPEAALRQLRDSAL